MPKEQTVYVIIDTCDVDELDVYVYHTPKAARARVLSLLDGQGLTDDEGEPIEQALMVWEGEADLDVWEPAGRVCMILKAKTVHK